MWPFPLWPVLTFFAFGHASQFQFNFAPCPKDGERSTSSSSIKPKSQLRSGARIVGKGGEQGDEIDRLLCQDGQGEGGAEEDREQGQPAGDLREAPQRAAEEGVRAVGAVRRGGGAHHLLQPRPPLRVLQQLQLPSSLAAPTPAVAVACGTRSSCRRHLRHPLQLPSSHPLQLSSATAVAVTRRSHYSYSRQLKGIEVADIMRQNIHYHQMSHSNLLGEDLGPLSIHDLQQLANKIEMSLKKIRSTKMQVMFDQLCDLNHKEQVLHEANTNLKRQLQEAGSPNLLQLSWPNGDSSAANEPPQAAGFYKSQGEDPPPLQTGFNLSCTAPWNNEATEGYGFISRWI
ncbi:hypothetical protein MUK42_13170 [Musa troglodytarum]|uniref:K-box domain-containing protein n=2 Tax=Musa troglodytarum TaxID=320322 RepID=A0A9E7GTM8_9LILI|nr:hypothetical protein MUK42_13170 [Musa troglodytarum]